MQTIDPLQELLRKIVIFRHLNSDEIIRLKSICRVSEFKKGQTVDLRKTESLNIVFGGMFEAEGSGSTDIVYLAPGSFFGTVPFSENRHTGRVRATVDSSLCIIGSDEFAKFIIGSHRALRGYISIITKSGFEPAGKSSSYLKCKGITSFYSHGSQSGKSFSCAMAAALLSKGGSVLAMDLSYKGSSIFNYFGAKITAPVSQKSGDQGDEYDDVRERIVKVNENLHLLNVSFGSNVRVDYGIIEALVILFSNDYDFIMLDLSSDDKELRGAAFSVSDSIVAVVKKKKEIGDLSDIFDAELVEGQRLFYLLNEFYSGSSGPFKGGYIAGDFGSVESWDYSRLAQSAESAPFRDLVSAISSKRKALVLAPNHFDSVFYSGFLAESQAAGVTFDFLYSSSYSYIVAMMWEISREEKHFVSLLSRFFRSDRFNSMLDVSFPENYIFGSSTPVKFFQDISSSDRIEFFKTVSILAAASSSLVRTRNFSTGQCARLMAAAFCEGSLFDGVEIAGGKYLSSSSAFTPETLLRLNIDEVAFAAVENSSLSSPGNGRLLPFFDKYLSSVKHASQVYTPQVYADRKYIINIDEKEINAATAFKKSSDISNKLLKQNS